MTTAKLTQAEYESLCDASDVAEELAGELEGQVDDLEAEAAEIQGEIDALTRRLKAAKAKLVRLAPRAAEARAVADAAHEACGAAEVEE
jgi:predicted  nucleic acid-binding Zn-ribbon protein